MADVKKSSPQNIERNVSVYNGNLIRAMGNQLNATMPLNVGLAQGLLQFKAEMQSSNLCTAVQVPLTRCHTQTEHSNGLLDQIATAYFRDQI